jgi:hypothetical protein
MGRWWVANGGPLALVVVGLVLTGFTTPYGWVLVALGVVLWAAERFRQKRKPEASGPEMSSAVPRPTQGAEARETVSTVDRLTDLLRDAHKARDEVRSTVDRDRIHAACNAFMEVGYEAEQLLKEAEPEYAADFQEAPRAPWSIQPRSEILDLMDRRIRVHSEIVRKLRRSELPEIAEIGAAIAQYEITKAHHAGMARTAIVNQSTRPGPFSSFEVEKPLYGFHPETKERIVVTTLKFTNAQNDRPVILEAQLVWRTLSSSGEKQEFKFLSGASVPLEGQLVLPQKIEPERVLDGTVLHRSFAEPFAEAIGGGSIYLKQGNEIVLRLKDRISGQEREVTLDGGPAS